MRFGSRGQTGLLSALVLASCLCRSFATRASRASSTAAASAWVSPSVWSARGGLASTRATRLQHSMATPSMTEQAKKKNPFNFSWQQTMLRIKDPSVSLPFYEEVLGFKRVHEYHFDTFSLYFMYSPKPGEQLPSVVPSKESEAFLWSMPGTTLELTWNHGTEKQADFSYNNGNVEPHRGFGHIAIAADDVYAACEKFTQAGVSFQKKPDEGRMKGLAFIKDPDGYWVEVISRDPSCFTSGPSYNLAQTMLRVKDPAKSLHFYRDLMGMHLLAVKHFSDFSLYFLTQHPPASAPLDPESEEAWTLMKAMHDPGTESDAGFSYHNGNKEPRGFGHTGFLVDDLQASCKFLDEAGVPFQKRPEEGSMRGLAFVRDPDDYWVEIVQRGLTI